MPSGKTHDAITLLLVPPTFAAAWGLTRSLWLAGVVTAATLFGGLMFGPDLDIQSRQYTRWGPFRLLWWPYKVVFRHRSRWSHGIVFGTLIRVVYFALVLTLVTTLAVYLRATLVAGAALPTWDEVLNAASAVRAGASQYGADTRFAIAVFAGLWWGAATHTLTDVAVSVVRKGSEIF
ncbi:MAG TPA: metal-binding protein [Pyrinomonadaceae bacterium]|nr:metal-binding protein [Pyrinomonadaceae bacterium]